MKKVFIPSIPTRFDQATKSRVPSLDLNPAAGFGELVHMTEDAAKPLQGNLALIRSITEDELAPDDYVLCVGDIVLAAAAIAYACQKNGSAKLLRWDRVRHLYDVEEVTL